MHNNFQHLILEWFASKILKNSFCNKWVCFVDFFHFWPCMCSAKILENRCTCSPSLTSFPVSDFALWWLVGNLDESIFQKCLNCAELIPLKCLKMKSPNTALCAAPSLKRRQKGQIWGVFWPFEGEKCSNWSEILWVDCWWCKKSKQCKPWELRMHQFCA